MKTTSRHFSDKLTTEERDLLPSSDFGIPETREFPMPDAAHVRAAEAYFRYASETDKPLLDIVPGKVLHLPCELSKDGHGN